jgi:hypothetical protein
MLDNFAHMETNVSELSMCKEGQAKLRCSVSWV